MGEFPTYNQGGATDPDREGDRGDSGPSVVVDVRQEITGIYKDHFGGIYRYCAYRLFKRSYAEDATAAVFLRLVEKHAALRAKGKEGIRNWLYGTARNVVASYFRDARRRREILAEVAAKKGSLLSQGTKKANGDNWPRVYEAIGKLKQRDQELIALRYFQGLETSAIAEALGMKHVTVRVYLSRATKRLKQELGDSYARP